MSFHEVHVLFHFLCPHRRVKSLADSLSVKLLGLLSWLVLLRDMAGRSSLVRTFTLADGFGSGGEAGRLLIVNMVGSPAPPESGSSPQLHTSQSRHVFQQCVNVSGSGKSSEHRKEDSVVRISQF